MTNQDTTQTLKNSMYITRASRFNADERLKRQHKLAHISMIMLAVYIIALSILDKFNILIEIQNYSDFISICLSILLLGITGIEYGNNRIEKAMLLHQNALNINRLYHSIIEKEEHDNEIQLKYDEALNNCMYNHEKIDYLCCKKNDDSLKWRKYCFAFKYWLLRVFLYEGLYYAIILAPIPFLIYFLFI